MIQQEWKTIDLRGLALVYGGIAWLVGIFIDSFLLLPPLMLLMMAAVALILIFLLWHEQRVRLITCVTLCLLLGAWRCSNASPKYDPLAISKVIGTNLTIQGEVSDEPKLYTHTRLLSITPKAISRDGGATWQETHGQLTIQILGTEIDDPYGANYGSQVTLSGKLLSPFPNSTPDILASMFFPRVQVTSTGGNPILATLYSWRVTLQNIIAQALPQPEAALMIAILLGLHTPALHPLVTAFSETATTHLTVSSGFKVTLLAGLVANSTRWLGKPKTAQGKLLPAQKRGGWRRWLSTLLILISIAIYTVLNGAGPAAIRAGIMGSLLVIAPRIGRTYNIYTSLAFTAVLISFLDPFVLWDVSFQLSFLGTLGIVLLTPFFQRLLHPIERIPTGHLISEVLAVSLAAQVATLPILVLDFHVLSLIGPIANMLTVPLLGIFIILGVLICGCGLLFLPLASLAGWVAWPLLWYIKNIVTWCANVPGAYINVGTLDSMIVWCYYAILVLIIIFAINTWPSLASTHTQHPAKHDSPPGISRRTWQLIQLGMALLIIIATGVEILISQNTTNLTTITFLDVTPQGKQPQGEAILLRTPDGKTVLIDGGLDASALAQELDSRLPSWQHSLDAVLLTTPMQDHLTGLLDIAQRYTIGTVLDAGMLHPSTTYTLWRRTINERNIHYQTASQGMSFNIGKFVSLQFLWPTYPLHKGSDEVRANTLIVRIVSPGLNVLLLGASAQNKYALSGLLDTVDTALLQADVVQMVEEASIPFPPELDSVLQRANPKLLLMTPAALSKKQPKVSTPSTTQRSTSLVGREKSWQNVQTMRTAKMGNCEISSSEYSCSLDTA